MTKAERDVRVLAAHDRYTRAVLALDEVERQRAVLLGERDSADGELRALARVKVAP